MKNSAKWLMGMCFLGMMSLSGLGIAEFYKYIDENGEVRFTDNLANVPPEQREDVEEYEESQVESPRSAQDSVIDKGSEIGSEASGVNGPPDGQADQAPASQGGSGTEHPLSALEEKLLADGEQLKEEFDALMEERAQLDAAASKRLTPAAQRALEKRIQEFNARIKDYDERRKAHNQAIEDYKLSGQ